MKIKDYTWKLRSRNFSAPENSMADILEDEEEMDFQSLEELPEDAGLKEIVEKLNEVCRRMEKIERAVSGGEIEKRVAAAEMKAETCNGKTLVMTKEYKAVKQDLAVIRGLVHRQHLQINNLDDKVVDLTARSMANNIVISGIMEERNENCFQLVVNFLKTELAVDMAENSKWKIKVAHRIGPKRNGGERPIVAKISDALKQVIIPKLELLVGRLNPAGRNYYLNIQQPEARVESRRNAKALLKKYQGKYKTAKVEMKGDKVYVNNEWKRPPVRAPTPRDMYYDPNEQKAMNKMKIIYTPPSDAGSCTFWAAAVRTDTTHEVQRAYNKIRQDHPDLEHVSVAYVAQHEGSSVSGLVDDKEHGVGYRILKAIRENKEENVAVFVARKFGGVHLGPLRFDKIRQVSEKAIQLIKQLVPPSPQPGPTQNPHGSPAPILEVDPATQRPSPLHTSSEQHEQSTP